jgi:hypothetical protein
MVPISEAMFDPTLPANMMHMMLDANSSSITSLMAYPMVMRGIQGDHILIFICTHSNAPMKNDISMTINSEL